MSAHTKGPWAQDKYGHVIDASGAEVLFRGVTTLSAGSPERIEMAEANTTLTAAAPELLEALKELIAARDEPFPPFEAGQPAQEAWVMRGVNAEAAARAAIQKAEGTT